MHADFIISDFDGWRVVDVDDGGYASFNNCTFAGNTLFRSAGGSGVMHVGLEPFTDSAVRLEAVSFSNNTLAGLPTIFKDLGGSNLDAPVYSDDEDLVVCTYSGESRKDVFEPICGSNEPNTDICYLRQPCNDSSPIPLAQAPNDGSFMSAEDVWFVQQQQV